MLSSLLLHELSGSLTRTNFLLAFLHRLKPALRFHKEGPGPALQLFPQSQRRLPLALALALTGGQVPGGSESQTKAGQGQRGALLLPSDKVLEAEPVPASARGRTASRSARSAPGTGPAEAPQGEAALEPSGPRRHSARAATGLKGPKVLAPRPAGTSVRVAFSAEGSGAPGRPLEGCGAAAGFRGAHPPGRGAGLRPPEFSQSGAPRPPRSRPRARLHGRRLP